MNDEEMDVYIKGKIKDGHIPERIDNLFNNSIKIIENKGVGKMETEKIENIEEKQNLNQNNKKGPEKKKVPVALKRVVATAACLIVLLGGGNLYAMSQGYDNIFFLIKHIITGEDVRGKENILSDRDITISYRSIEIAEGTQIQINSLVIKDNEAKLKIKVNEAEAKEIITPLTYIIKDESGDELCNYKSTQSQIETDYQEVLTLENYKDDTKKLELELLKNDATRIVTFEIDLENKEINVIGNAEEVTKISEEELKQYLGAFAMLSYKGTEYRDFSKDTVGVENTKKMFAALQIAEINNIDIYTNDIDAHGGEKYTSYNTLLDREKVNSILQAFTTVELNQEGALELDLDEGGLFDAVKINGKLQYSDGSWVLRDDIISPTCLEITNIDYIGGIYNVTFKFCYSTEANKGFGESSIEDLPVYEMSIGLILNEDNEYSKYKVSTISEATLFEEKKDETVNNDSEKSNAILNFDLGFLKMENEEINKLYSPLSIKYALKMLEEAAEGDSKLQITNVLSSYTPTKYNSNSNMVLANALFIRNSFANSVKQNYINTLRNKYGAEIIFDSFSNAKNVNTWVSNKTLNLIQNLLSDIDVAESDFMLINALGIDMEWEEKFLKMAYCIYNHENFSWVSADNVRSHEFNEKEQLVSGMEIVASINNYDIVTELGEENIRKTVGDEFRKWAKSLKENDWEYEDWFNGDLSDGNIEKELNKYLDRYITEINSNYKRVDYSTDFSLYVDDNVKAFSKDLKEYDGTTLQYIGIMPTTEELQSYVNNTDETKINNIISNLKDLKTENFNGVVTKITGYIPKFKFEYELNLKEDLKQLGITDVFEQGKANLTEICNDKGAYINKAAHKANIEFTQDGIKAAAATMVGGLGAGSGFDYIYDIPVEEIDLTFDKPYMFLIRDKETGEIWFTGTVYEPLSWNKEPEKDNAY